MTPPRALRRALCAALPCAAALCAPPRTVAAPEAAPPLSQDQYERQVEERRRALSARFAASDATARAWAAEDPEHRLAAHCVKADRAAGEVSISAFTTELAPGAIAEFALITLNSGHEYEAVFQTEASATDIEKAMRFVGAAPGAPVDPAAFRFWPRGERVFATVSLDGAPALPLEAFLADAKTGKPWPPTGFVHCGGVPAAGGTNEVDFAGPGSVVPSYNERFSLFDVPRLAAQNDVYESVVASTNVPGEGWLPATIAFRPEARPAPLPPARVRDVALRIVPDGAFALDGAEAAPAASAVETLRQLVERDKCDPFLSVSWDGSCSVSELRAAAQLLSVLEGAGTGVRVDAPPPGFPFYRAFVPPEEWRDRSQRYTQPCELRFAADGPATLVAIREVWSDDKIEPDLQVSQFPVPSPDALPALLAEHSPATPRAILVFAPGSTKWGEIAPFVQKAAATHPLVQIFQE